MGVARLTDNERIARWAHTVVPIEKDPPDLGDIIIAGGNCSVWTDCGWQYWDPDTDITLWHGLLAEIERRGKLAGAGGLLFALHEQYRAALPRECGLTGPVAAVGWEKFLLKATSAQLAAALVKVIEGGG